MVARKPFRQDLSDLSLSLQGLHPLRLLSPPAWHAPCTSALERTRHMYDSQDQTPVLSEAKATTREGSCATDSLSTWNLTYAT